MPNPPVLPIRQSRRIFTTPVILLALSLIGLIVAPSLFAQDAAETADAAASGQTSMLEQLKNGGWWMAPIYLNSVAMVTLIVFHSMQLTKRKFIPDDLRLTLYDHMQNCRVRSAIEVASVSPTFLGRMMANALPAVDATQPETLGRENVEDHMAEFTIRENGHHMRTIGFYSVIAQSSPMLGLLGTVVGMLQAFGKLAATGGAAGPDKLAGDISLALITTVGGLVVAIPSVMAYFFFKGKLGKLVSDCHDAAGKMLDASVAAVNADQLWAKVPEGLSEEG